jgi:peptidoglycan/LPS O-acetylase OafA/YrhL
LVFAALLLGLRAYDAALAKLLPVRALMQTGRASYSIYLTHTLCLTMLHLTMKVAHIEDAVFLRFAASFVASIVFGFVFFQFAERPFLSAPKPVKKEPAASDPVTASRFAPAP